MSETWRVEEYGLPGETDLWTDGTVTIEVPKSFTRRLEADHEARRQLDELLDALSKEKDGRWPVWYADQKKRLDAAVKALRDALEAARDYAEGWSVAGKQEREAAEVAAACSIALSHLPDLQPVEHDEGENDGPR